MAKQDHARLREAVRTIDQRRQAAGLPPLDLTPRTAYEAITREMVEAQGRELAEMRARVNGVIFAVVGAVIIGVVMQLLGA